MNGSFYDTASVKEIQSAPGVFVTPLLTTLMYLLILGLSGFGAIASVKKEIDARMAGVIGMSFFGVKGILDLIWTFVYGTPISGTFMLSILAFLMTIGIGLYFIGRKNELAKIIYLGGGVAIVYQFAKLIYQQAMFISNNRYEMLVLAYFDQISQFFTQFAIIGILVVQTAILEKRRKRQQIL